MKLVLLDKIEAVRPFTQHEAWGLFRLAAFGEAIGWSLLTTGVLASRYKLAGFMYMLPIAGQIHGLLFLFYFGILLATSSSLRWPRRWTVVAAAVGVIPFGTLIFEQWIVAAERRTNCKALLYRAVAATAHRDMLPSNE